MHLLKYLSLESNFNQSNTLKCTELMYLVIRYWAVLDNFSSSRKYTLIRGKYACTNVVKFCVPFVSEFLRLTKAHYTVYISL